MAMERPCWTICLFILWGLILPALIWTHVSVAGLLPGIKDLPSNIIVGFDDIFGFSRLETEAGNIRTASDTAIAMCYCGVTKCSSTQCLLSSTALVQAVVQLPVGTTNPATVDTTQQKNTINAAFASTLNQVDRVVSDPYFGTSAFASTASNLQTVQNEINNNLQNAVGPCSAIVPTYCRIRDSADAIVRGIGTVNAEITKFKNSDAIKMWKDSSDLFVTLHAMPYTLVAMMALFTLFWYVNSAVCCCCEGGKGGSKVCICLIAVPLMFLFWLFTMIMWGIVVAVGAVLSFPLEKAKDAKIDFLNNDPSLDTICQHLATKFPAFWSKTFKDIYEHLPGVYRCGIVFVIVAISICIYSLCACCVRPYQKKDEPKAVQGQVIGNQGI
jgi:hypothetical protein